MTQRRPSWNTSSNRAGACSKADTVSCFTAAFPACPRRALCCLVQALPGQLPVAPGSPPMTLAMPTLATPGHAVPCCARLAAAGTAGPAAWLRLARLLAHAHAHSPLWARAPRPWARCRGHPRPGRLRARSPITTREDLRSPEALLARGFERASLKTAMTSGSTGRRTTTYFDRDAWFVGKHLPAARAAGLRHAPTDRVALFQEADPSAPDTPGRAGAHLLDPRAAGKRDRGRGRLRPGRPLRLSRPSPAVGDGRSRQGPAAADHLGRAAGGGDARSDRGAVRRPSLRRLRLDRGEGDRLGMPGALGHINADWLWSRPPPPRIRRGAPPTASW